MLETSKDFLYIAIGAAVLGLAGFTCWAIYYFAMILRQAFKIVKEMRDRLTKIDELMQTLKEKIEHSTSYLLLIGEGVKKLVEIIREHTGADKGDGKKTRSKKA
ncbi:hypothetical protein A2303_03440 [Candidatus Falkowbacteria bacterium RIFOXYB2_FULL_47_14]|uniref:Uncharacterized protein n=1 Tax=Candidatus Falkowbacteria bacterium RIFOXYA2_FULL_47_19 TaxID=1797994 RepID=A0A1F5SI51_9BACT|nr:MAG: hypothetical protein A2227_02990 [Candidatus Falkowbacteria bacterium RIFOXYA2_FULL_47_19]OGF36719.1 MAG: hypothetical protein A2468_02785 [Candidatus Falkowbacteria bacterium RIFOXYC2_FULL_46_15]OGF42454.1 MAG: hypothetical protein A2303_03440 [Candidatus Falkowbacteria bacterium RIFOXYB2_FULL_47_14]